MFGELQEGSEKFLLVLTYKEYILVPSNLWDICMEIPKIQPLRKTSKMFRVSNLATATLLSHPGLTGLL